MFTRRLATLLVLLSLPLASCVERKERIVVTPDGFVEMTVVHRSGDLVDLLEGDAIPDDDAGWATELREEVREDGQIAHVFEARRTVLPGEALPSRYGSPKDRDAEQVLHFHTTLVVERRRDGVWYHFRRVYQPRRWAELGDLSESAPAKRLQQFGGLDGPDIPEETLDQLARALVDLQAERTLLLARRAFLAAAQRTPQDGWLRVREAMHRFASELDARAVVEQFQLATRIEHEAKRAEAIQKALRQLEGAVEERLHLAMRAECGFGASEMSTFLNALARERTESAITEDLADDDFEITVVMPGQIMGTNGRELPTPGESAVVWSFRGDKLFDRPIELLVTSRVVD